MVIEEDRPIFALFNFFDPISSFAAIRVTENCGKMPPLWKILITWLFSPESDQTKNLKATLDAYKRWEFS